MNKIKKIFIFPIILLFSATCIAVKAANTDAMLQYNQGIDYYKTGRYDEAITSFREAISLDPNYIDAYYNLGTVLEYLQQYDAALAVFKQIIVRKPDDYDSVYKAAWLSYKLGEKQKAKIYLSIIPSTCARSKDAQMLARQLNMSLGNSSVQQDSSSKKNTVKNDSAIYNNIPAPTGITTDGECNVYVAEFNTNTIIKITPDNKKMVYVKDAKISGPIGLAYDDSKNMYIANYNKNNILKISPYGEISVLINNVSKPYYLHIDGNILFVYCQGSDSVLKYKL